MSKIKRNALNRGTAVHLGANKVRFVWACGCTKVQLMKAPGRHGSNYSKWVTAKLVNWWRMNGVDLEQCKKHPDYYNPKSQLERLNKEYPQK